jgi:hypothetical protein
MGTFTKSISARIVSSFPGFRILNLHILKPVKAGIRGFALILLVILFVELFSIVFGHKEKLSIVSSDFLLPGLGFFLQSIGALVQSFIK